MMVQARVGCWVRTNEKGQNRPPCTTGVVADGNGGWRGMGVSRVRNGDVLGKDGGFRVMMSPCPVS